MEEREKRVGIREGMCIAGFWEIWGFEGPRRRNSVRERERRGTEGIGERVMKKKKN